jgi:hypothetical protein
MNVAGDYLEDLLEEGSLGYKNTVGVATAGVCPYARTMEDRLRLTAVMRLLGWERRLLRFSPQRGALQISRLHARRQRALIQHGLVIQLAGCSTVYL